MTTRTSFKRGNTSVLGLSIAAEGASMSLAWDIRAKDPVPGMRHDSDPDPGSDPAADERIA